MGYPVQEARLAPKPGWMFGEEKKNSLLPTVFEPWNAQPTA